MIKQTSVRRTGVAAALLLALGVTTMVSNVSAQEASPSGSGEASPSVRASVAAQASPAVVQEEDNDVPWGLLGLLGLGGLAGLRRRPEPVREGASKIGVYDNNQQR